MSVYIQGGDGGSAGWGRVTSVPAGIDCPTTCSASFPGGSTVELTATPKDGYALREWSALPNTTDCEQPPSCKLRIGSSDIGVTAIFHPAAQLTAATAGPGRLWISPVEPGHEGFCEVDAQQPTGSCIHRYPTGTQVTATAEALPGARFVGWSDYRCSSRRRACVLDVSGERFITARFSPVRLRVEGSAFGGISVSPAPGGFCPMQDSSPPCTVAYRSGTTVTLRRDHAAPGLFWVGACRGNRGGLLDAHECKLRVWGNELVGAGYEGVTAIPPPLGSGLTVVVAGKRRGKVTGAVDKGDGRALDCGSRCTIKGLTRYDRIRLTATRRRGGRFVGWSDGSRVRKRTVELSHVNQIKATFR